MKKKQNKGFTFVEIMVAVALLGGLSVLITKVTKNANKSSVRFQTDIDATAIANEIMGNLADPEVCGLVSNLKGRSIVGLPAVSEINSGMTALTKRDGSVIYSTANTDGYGSSKLLIDSYTFSDTTGDDVDISASPRSLFFVVNFKKRNTNLSTESSSTQIKRMFKINFLTNLSNAGTLVESCKALAIGYDGVWARNANQFSEIFYPGSYVGIGVSDPSSFLHVSNTSTVAAQTTAAFLQPAQPVNSSQLIKIGVDWTTANNAGVIKYVYNNSASNQNRLDFGIQGLSSLLVFRGDGKAGIGTTAPNVSMDVLTGGVRARGGAPGANGIGNNGYAFSGSGDNDSGMFSLTDDQLLFYSNANEYIRLTTAGVSIAAVADAIQPLTVGNGVATSKITAVRGNVYTTTGIMDVGKYKSTPSLSHIDLKGSAGADYDMRIIRYADTDGDAAIIQKGTGNLNIGSNNSLAMYLDQNNYTNISNRLKFPSTVNTQGLTSTGGLGIYANDLASKQWVQQQIRDVLSNPSQQDLNGILATKANYENSETIKIMKNAICINSRIYITGGSNYTGSFNYSTGVCTYTIPNYVNCTVPGNCSTLYATNMYATTMWANSFCSNYSGGACVTVTGKYKCANGYFVIGLANGLPTCYNPWSTATANSYSY